MDEDRSLFAVSDRSLFWQCSGHLGCVQVQTDAYSSKLPHRQYGCELHIQCLEILRLSNSKKKKGLETFKSGAAYIGYRPRSVIEIERKREWRNIHPSFLFFLF